MFLESILCFICKSWPTTGWFHFPQRVYRRKQCNRCCKSFYMPLLCTQPCKINNIYRSRLPHYCVIYGKSYLWYDPQAGVYRPGIALVYIGDEYLWRKRIPNEGFLATGVLLRVLNKEHSEVNLIIQHLHASQLKV